MPALKLYKRYLSALNAGNLNGVLAAFAADATVVSPTLGTIDVRSYYQQFFAHTHRSIIKLLDVSDSPQSANDPARLTLHFRYTWVPKKGQPVTFDSIKVFDLTPDAAKFTKLTIICDASPIWQRLRETGVAPCLFLGDKHATEGEELSSVGL
jgi:hypothetical protein